MYSYLIIGNKWGSVIYNILKSLNKKVNFKTINYSKTNKKKYLEKFDKVISESKADIIWLAIPPFDYLSISNIMVKFKKNVIFEKPWIFSKEDTLKISSNFNKNNLKNAVNFEYVYLYKLNDLHKNEIDYISYNFHTLKKNKYNISSKLELGSHLAAIHLDKFSKVSNFDFFTSYGIENKRMLELKLKNGSYNILDFTLNRELIIQKFISDFEKNLLKVDSFKYDINFGCKVYEMLKK